MTALAEAARTTLGGQCRACGGQLGVIAGPVWRSGFTRYNADGTLREDAFERDEHNNVTPRARCRSHVACGSCMLPVPLDHPMQVALDRDCAARAQQDQIEADAEKARRDAALASVVPLKPLAPSRLEELERENAAKDRTITEMEKRLAALEQEGRRKR